jgi:hypothetical protein
MTKGTPKPGNPSPFPPLTSASMLLCPHGGNVTSLPTGMPPAGYAGGALPLKITDPMVVSGCAHTNPCIRAQWVGGVTQTPDMRSIALCWSKENIPNGTVIVARV